MLEMVPEGSKCLFSQCEKRHFGSFPATDKLERRNLVLYLIRLKFTPEALHRN